MKEDQSKSGPRISLWGVLIAVFGIIVLSLAGYEFLQPPAVAGQAGIGDTYYTELGNGGYDVQKYTLILNVDPLTNLVDGETRIEAQALDRLKSFNLDFRGLEVDSVIVNNSQAAFARGDQELTITPKRALRRGRIFTTIIQYHGQPSFGNTVTNVYNMPGMGWFHDKDGSINVLSEPNGASTWYPVNDHPRDKAAYRFEITVPKPWVVAATGMLKETVEVGGSTRFVFEMGQPMASYLVSINIDHYEIETAQGPDGVTIRNYFPAEFREFQWINFRLTPEMMTYFTGLFGPYPFQEYGVVVTDMRIKPCNNKGLAIETQSLTVICPNTSYYEPIIAHELAHQWFGDSVSLKNWQDLWLKEGLATYAEWMWTNRNQSIEEFNQLAERNRKYFFGSNIGEPPPESLYRDAQYTGGALTMHALRLKVGDEAFFKILQTYLERYRDGNASTEEFIAVSEEVSGQELSDFFDSWLLAEELPEFPEK